MQAQLRQEALRAHHAGGGDEGGYPIYKRSVGNEPVVPHNADKVLIYDFHINVELCISV